MTLQGSVFPKGMGNFASSTSHDVNPQKVGVTMNYRGDEGSEKVSEPLGVTQLAGARACLDMNSGGNSLQPGTRDFNIFPGLTLDPASPTTGPEKVSSTHSLQWKE